MRKKNIIIFVVFALLIFMILIAKNLSSIINSYQNIFKTKVCTNSFCIKKPKDYLIAGVINKGNTTYSIIPVYNKVSEKAGTYIMLFLVEDFKKAIMIGEFNTTKVNNVIDKFKLKKVIDGCYDLTELVNKYSDLNESIHLICPKKKIDISCTGNKDYKTIKYILDGFSIKDKNNSKE